MNAISLQLSIAYFNDNLGLDCGVNGGCDYGIALTCRVLNYTLHFCNLRATRES